MNIKVWALAALFAGSLVLTGCDDDDDKRTTDVIQLAFNNKYPGAVVHEWEAKNGYMVADFINDGYEAEAWFDPQGQWYMTETDFGRNIDKVPAAVQQAFRNSSYAAWYVDDINRFEYPNQSTVYQFDLEQGERDYILQILEDGTVTNDPGGNNPGGTKPEDPNQPSDKPGTGQSDITLAIDELYKGAKILEIDREYNRIKVDILHEQREKEVVFDEALTWQYTTWDVWRENLPELILEYIRTNYPDALIDDADYYEVPSAAYFEVDLEQRGIRDITLWFDNIGNLADNPFVRI